MDGSVWRRWLGGLLIACLVLATVWAGLRWVNSAENTPATGAEISSLKLDYQTLRSRTDSAGGNWLRTLNSRMKDVQGDLTWNGVLQRGVMRFINLPSPKGKQRYQLWIHDSRSPDGKPVLGAVLESGSGKQELFVAIQADKTVLEPFKFVLSMGEAGASEADGQIMLMVQP